MTRVFVSRHRGAQDWAKLHAPCARIVETIDPEDVAAGDIVEGVLPVDVAAHVCARGARFFALEYDRTGLRRGAELSAAELEARGARLTEYRIVRV